VGCTKAPSDAQVSEQIHAKFNQDSGLQGKSIAVQATAGVVTLSGTVDNDAQRTAASRYASTIPGVKEVVNNLQVAVSAQAVPPLTPVTESVAPMPAPSPAKPQAGAPRRTKSSSSARPASKPEPPLATQGNSDEPASTDQERATNQPGDENPSSDSSPAPEAPSPKIVTIQSGTTMTIRLVDSIDSETAKTGQTFKATLDSPLSSEWEVAIPAGCNLEGHVVDVKSAGKFSGKSELVLQLDRISVGGKSYNIQTDQFSRQGKNRSTNTAEKVGGGALLGAIIGGIAGGGKGAGIGAAAGGGVGGGVQAATRGEPVKLPSETVLNFTLASPLTVTQGEQGPEPERHKLEPAK
jgi:hypothetical protein